MEEELLLLELAMGGRLLCHAQPPVHPQPGQGAEWCQALKPQDWVQWWKSRSAVTSLLTNGVIFIAAFHVAVKRSSAEPLPHGRCLVE